MATNSQQLQFAIRAVNEASKALKDVQGDIGALEGVTEKSNSKLATLSGHLLDIGKIAAGIAVAKGLDLAVSGIGNSISLARDYNEILSKSNTIFGDQASAIENWAGSASTAFGQSKAQALDAAASFGNMFTQLGLGGQTAADMSIKMTELASDFASFHNADITEVLTAQQAAFRGEYDALQRFVPTINAASVAQEALAQTGKTSTDQLTAGEKAAAAYSLMIKGAGDAQGDFERTSGSLANQQRILSAQWQDFQAQVGQALIPALTAIAIAVNTQVIPAIRDFAEKTRTYWESDIKPAIDNLRAAWEKVDQDVLPILQTMIADFGRVAQNFALMVGIIVDLINGDWGQAWAKVKQIVQNAVDSVTEKLDILKNTGSEILHGFLDGMRALWNDEIRPFLANLPTRILETVGDLSNLLYGIGKSIALGLLSGLKDGVTGVWDEVSGWGGKIKDLKGPIEKDRELLVEEGLAIAKSLEKGLGTGFASVEMKVKGWAEQIKTAALDVAAKAVRDMQDFADMAKGVPMTDANGEPLSSIPTVNQYNGGGNYQNSLGPNGTVWDSMRQAFVYPWAVGSLGTPTQSNVNNYYGFGNSPANPAPIVVNVQGSVWSVDELAYELQRRGFVTG